MTVNLPAGLEALGQHLGESGASMLLDERRWKGKPQPARGIVRRMTASVAAAGDAWVKEASTTATTAIEEDVMPSVGEALLARFPNTIRLAPATASLVTERVDEWWAWWRCRAVCCRPTVA